MRGFAGYNFKAGKISDDQRRILEDYLAVFDGASNGASEWKADNKIFLLHKAEKRTQQSTWEYYTPWNNLFVYGIGQDNQEASDGIVWGSNEDNIRQALYYSSEDHQLLTNSYPYKVETDTILYVEDGEIYSSFKKNDKVSTPNGPGTIFSIDDLHDICVELDSDKTVYYEFMVTELKKIKETT